MLKIQKKRALNTFSGTLTETDEPMKTLFGLGCGQTGPKNMMPECTIGRSNFTIIILYYAIYGST